MFKTGRPLKTRTAITCTLTQVLLIIALAAAVALTGCARPQPTPGGDQSAYPKVPPDTLIPEQFRVGEQLYNTHCANCHGERGSGTQSGPPLVHVTYQPNHHADDAFLVAVQQGVREHHWNFGNMPPLPGVSAQDVARIVRYVRYLQQEIGIR